MGETFAGIANDGPLLLAIAVSALAGLVSFLSPCVLPLMPGYLSYVTGLAGADLDSSQNGCAVDDKRAGTSGVGETARTDESAGETVPADESAGTGGVAVATRPARVKGRVLAGTVLFVLGFAVVFTLMATLVSNIGVALQANRAELNIVLGILIIVLGLAFMGLIPGMQREFRIHKLPNAGLAGAPVFGALFGLSWLPCTGPTLGAVLGLATTTGQADRAVVLALAYSLGLGVPFVLFGLFFRKLLGVFKAVRRHSRWVTRIGGALLIVTGLALVTGGWDTFLIWLLTTFNFDAGTLL